MASNRRDVKVTFAGADSYEPYEPHLGQRGRIVAAAVLLLVVSLLVYLPGLRRQFIVGEDDIVARNTVLGARWDGLKAIWLHPTVSPHYQPLAYTALLLEYGGVMRWRGFGTSYPQAYLVVNLLLHAGNVLLLWTLLRKLEVPGALAGAVLFAVHPINVETVAWINQQPLLWCGVFYLSALLVYLRFCGLNPAPPPGPTLRLPEARWALYGLSVLLLAAALTSHAVAVSLPLVALVLIWWERGRHSRRDLLNLLPLMLISAAWLAMALYADARRAVAINDVLEQGVLGRALVWPRALWIYLSHLLLPWGLSFAYPKWSPGWIDAAAALALGAVFVAAWCALKRVGRGPLASVLLLLLAVGPMFLLRSDLDRHAYVADHLAYLAGMVLAAALVAGLSHGLSQLAPARLRSLPPWATASAATVAAVALAALTLHRLPDFQSSQNLWNSALRAQPDSPLAHNQLGLIALNQDKDKARALTHFQAALDADKNNPQTHINIAAVYEADELTQKAIYEYQQALALAPDNPEAHFGLAHALATQGSSEEALREYRVVLTLRPDHVLTHNNIGLLHQQRGEIQLAIASYERAMAINPGFMPPYINLANLQFAQGQVESAAATLMRAVQIDPNNYEAYMNAGAMVAQLAESEWPSEPERIKLNEQAILFFGKAYRLRPNAPLACKHFAMSLLQRSRLLKDDNVSEAIFYLERAVELEPQNREYRQLLDQARRRRDQAASRG
jgi:tetratricopeptide (TPR) repeat protein